METKDKRWVRLTLDGDESVYVNRNRVLWVGERDGATTVRMNYGAPLVVVEPLEVVLHRLGITDGPN